MELPFEIEEFEPPNLSDVKRWLRAGCSWRGLLGLVFAAGLGYGAFRLEQHFFKRQAVATGVLAVSTTPAVANLSIDGRLAGQTPATVSLPMGGHKLRLTLSGYVPVQLPVAVRPDQTVTVTRELWPDQADILPVSAPLPGSRIDATSFQDDGSLALDVELASDAHQLWLLDGKGSFHRVGPTAKGGMALASDGHDLAFAGARGTDSLSFQTRNAVWTTEDGGQPRLLYVLPQSQTTAQITSLSWAPRSRQLLAVAANPGATGGAQSRLILLSADTGAERDLIDLPAAAIDGSFTWSPDGQQVAFLAKSSSATSLCLLDIGSGRFRALADIGGSVDALPVAELGWRPGDGRVLFSAEEPGQNVASLWGFGGTPAAKLYDADAAAGPASVYSSAPLRGPAVLSDGTVLGFARGKGGAIALESISQGTPTQSPVSTGLNHDRFAARWDLAHRQALILAIASASDGSDVVQRWLVRFTPGGGQ